MNVAIGRLCGDLQPCGVNPGICGPGDAQHTHDSHFHDGSQVMLECSHRKPAQGFEQPCGAQVSAGQVMRKTLLQGSQNNLTMTIMSIGSYGHR